MTLRYSSIIRNWNALTTNEQSALIKRPVSKTAQALRKGVSQIIETVRQGGDSALFSLTKQYDGANLTDLRVSEEEIQAAYDKLTINEHNAIKRAAKQIRFFHQPQRGGNYRLETAPGIQCSRIFRPIDSVGLYAPGGTAPLPSTVLMLGIPAQLAQCPRRILCSPPNPNASIDPAILVAASHAGISEIYKVGGAQAIAAMAYGTPSIGAVNKIFGPGNSWVTEAKLQVSLDPNGAACDMPAGPSEVLIIADSSTNAEFVAADLLSQAEHGIDSQVILLCTSMAVLTAVARELEEQLITLSRRQIAAQSLEQSALILVKSLQEAVCISNTYAPEHLILQTQNPDELLNGITNAGSVFVGPWSPEAVGDYASGTNHVLPTYGYAKTYSGLCLDAFRKKITVQKLSPSGLWDIGPTVETLATLEGLDGHKQAVTRRLKAMTEQEIVSHTAITQLARPEILQLSAYESARSKYSRADIFLDANENPRAPLSAQTTTRGINRYPEPQPQKLVQQLAKLYNVAPNNIIVGRGSDDIIDALVRCFCQANRDAILTCPPTYGVYRVAAELQGANVIEVPLTAEFKLDLASVVESWSPEVKLVFLCSPNNPTGTLIPLTEIEELCTSLANRSIVVVDEAYIEFANAQSSCTLLQNHDNLVILRTLSKAWAMAGARCGAGVAHQSIIELLQKVRSPYPLSTPAIELIQNCLSEQGIEGCNKDIIQLNEEREFLVKSLTNLPQIESITPSCANFILVKTTNAQSIVDRALEQGIILRDRSSEYNLGNCIRISVGTRKENNALIEALKPEALSA